MSERVPVEPVSKTMYLGLYIGSIVLGGILIAIGLVSIIGGAVAADSGKFDAVTGVAIGVGVIFTILASSLFVLGYIVVMVLYYKMWKAIQDGYARTTPGKAVGFMFIPLFNIYWIFQALWGYSKDYNEYLRRHSIQAKPLCEGLFLTACILPLAGGVPFLGGFAGIANLIISIILVNFICNSINALANSESEQVSPDTMAMPIQDS